MNVKIFDFEHEKDLEDAINDFIDGKNIVDIKYQVAVSIYSNDQVFCYSALILYK